MSAVFLQPRQIRVAVQQPPVSVNVHVALFHFRYRLENGPGPTVPDPWASGFTATCCNCCSAISNASISWTIWSRFNTIVHPATVSSTPGIFGFTATEQVASVSITFPITFAFSSYAQKVQNDKNRYAERQPSGNQPPPKPRTKVKHSDHSARQVPRLQCSTRTVRKTAR